MAKWGNCNFKQLEQMCKKLSTVKEEEINLFYEQCAKELAARLLALVIPLTPTGEGTMEMVNGKMKRVSHGGTLKRGWTTNTEEQAKSAKGLPKISETLSYAQKLLVTKKSGTYTLEIINPVSYASYVEYGHRQTPGKYIPVIGKKLKNSWVPGKFMLTKSEQQLDLITPQLLEKKIKKFLEECIHGK